MGMSALCFALSMLVAVSWAVPPPAEGPPKPASTQQKQNETVPSTPNTPPNTNMVGDKFNEFDWRLCRALADTEKGNIIISPISLKLVLAMVYEGANGETAQELASALGLSRENMARQITRTKFSNIVGNLKSSEGEYDLTLGTSLFIDKSVTPKPSYVRKLQSFYEAQIEQVDFSQAEEAVQAINAWASGATKGQIQNFLTKGEVSGDTILMLLNAIYFKGRWLYTFPANQTKTGTFYAGGNKPKTVNFMNSAYYLSYLDAPEINSQIVKLPYLGKKFAMYIIVPNNLTGLPKLIKQINPFILKKHTQNMYEALVELSLPSFKIDYTSNLGSVLRELGIKKLFGHEAELNDIAEVLNNSIAVSNVLQKAGIQVDEEGSTAFAATEAQIVNKFGDSPNVNLKVDRPFLFFIKDEETDTVLFVGSLVNPKSVNSGNETEPVETEKSTVTPQTEAVTTSTPKPANSTNTGTEPDFQALVELYFLKEAISENMKELIRFHYLSGTTSYDLEEIVELYVIVKTTTSDLEKLIEFYISVGVKPDEIHRLIKFYFLMDITSDDLEKFLKKFFVHGIMAKDVRALTKFFATKGVTPDVVQKLIQYYRNNSENFR